MTRRWLTPWRRRPAGPPSCGGLPCRAMVELVTDYLEGALSPEDRVRFEGHIGLCEHCTAYLEQMRVTLDVVGRIDPDALDPRVERALLDAFHDWKAGEQ
ncbi:MAG TPA: zf-HC2 domain-containing protein [Baekduia sp.]|nr:zf-HC2 domain-containing protein [Baekduia sp.]